MRNTVIHAKSYHNAILTYNTARETPLLCVYIQ